MVVGLLILASSAQEPILPQTGTVRIDIDARDVTRKIIHSKLLIPVKPGPLELLYPKWIPGEHGPTGPISDLAGLKIAADGEAVPWRRDEEDVYTFHCEVPARARELEVSLDFLVAPPSATEPAAASASNRLAILNWNQLLLYPKGRPPVEIRYCGNLLLPPGWKCATSLQIRPGPDGRFAFDPVSLETLMDSPVLCGLHLQEVSIGPQGCPPHFLEIACESEEQPELGPGSKGAFDRLVGEAGSLFGWHPYTSYRFLVALSDQVAHLGLEHRESSDIRAPERMFADEGSRIFYSTLFSHELVHAWNGKYRRPEGMVTGDYQKPQRTGLLWIYEGLTHYLAVVLNTRAGFWTEEQFRDFLAVCGDGQTHQKGRAWRPLSDATASAQLLLKARRDWASWRRADDFYDEGLLLWLEVDVLIRRRSGGSRSLDDFCRRFLKGRDGVPSVKPYRLEDVIEDLNATVPYDWRAFLARRTEAVSDKPPLGGITAAGWRLVNTDQQSRFHGIQEQLSKTIDLRSSIGILLGLDGMIVDVVPATPAFLAGVSPGMKLVAINSRRFTTEVLRSALARTKSSRQPLELLVENGDFFHKFLLDYRGGERYPHLERETTGEDILCQIIKPLTPSTDRKRDSK